MRNKLAHTHNPRFSKKKKQILDLPSNLKSIRTKIKLPEIVFITTFPPRECGIATYSQDLVFALHNKFKKSFQIDIVALESESEKHQYHTKLFSVLETDNSNSYIELSKKINTNKSVEMVLIQHEFGLFRNNEVDFITFLHSIHKPIIVVFHTVLPHPDEKLKQQVVQISNAVDSIIVMTNTSATILVNDYAVDADKITVIPHGTHLVEHSNKDILKEKYHLSGRKIISTFGLLSSGKCIETSIQALQQIVKEQTEVLFLVIGKTHPTVVKNEGESYRYSL